jgi:hypothetical protein
MKDFMQTNDNSLFSLNDLRLGSPIGTQSASRVKVRSEDLQILHLDGVGRG